MSRKHKDPPTRGYGWLGYVWVGAIGIFLTVGILWQQQFTWGEPQGTIVSASGNPLGYWAAVVGLAVVVGGTIYLGYQDEMRYRESRALFEEQQEGKR